MLGDIESLPFFSLTLIFSCVYYFVIAFIGALAKDLFDRISGKYCRMRPQRIILGGICGAFAAPSIYRYFNLSAELMLIVSFLIGILSFELFSKFSSLKGIKEVSQDINEIREILKLKQLINEEKIEQEKSEIENYVIHNSQEESEKKGDDFF